jgi:hypothetical protein
MNIDTNTNTITVDGKTYIEAGSQTILAIDTNGLKYVVIRSRDAGCHAGYLKQDNETSVELINSRRLWYWKGAKTLSELAINGVSNPSECKLGLVLPYIKIVNHCEIIHASSLAEKSIAEVPVWK